MSHRYGNRFLPTRIVADEFDLFREELNKQPQFDATFFSTMLSRDNDIASPHEFRLNNLLDDCYELDSNERPARYKLKHIVRIVPHYNDKEEASKKVWTEIEEKLSALMRQLANVCFEKKLIDRTQHERYFVSVTEKEIYNGILNAKNVANNALFFVREIEDIDEHYGENPALSARFIDLDKHKQLDHDAQRLLDELKSTKIREKLPDENIFRFRVKWDRKKGVTYATHPEYIREFGETFYKQVKRLIDLNKKQRSFYESMERADASLLQEILDHANFCNETVEKFHGRADLLNSLKAYLLNQSNKAPLLIYGNSGCGKTAILAKLTSEVSDTDKIHRKRKSNKKMIHIGFRCGFFFFGFS